MTTIVCFDCDGTWSSADFTEPCQCCDGSGLLHERMATPDEVDNGCELGIAYDPAPRPA